MWQVLARCSWIRLIGGHHQEVHQCRWPQIEILGRLHIHLSVKFEGAAGEQSSSSNSEKTQEGAKENRSKQALGKTMEEHEKVELKGKPSHPCATYHLPFRCGCLTATTRLAGPMQALVKHEPTLLPQPS